MDDREVMSLEDMDPGLRSGQVWKWKSPLNGHEGMYFLLNNHAGDDYEYEIVWLALDLTDGQTKYIYSVGRSMSWRRLV